MTDTDLEELAKKIQDVSKYYKYCVGRDNLTIENTDWNKLARFVAALVVDARIDEAKRTGDDDNYFHRIKDLQTQLTALRGEGI